MKTEENGGTMRDFYEAVSKAMDAKRPATAAEALTRAVHIMQPLADQAKARLELHLAIDLVELVMWAKAWAEYHAAGNAGVWPGLTPLCMDALGTTYVYPPAPRPGRRSIDYRWGKRQDRPDTHLPTVVMSHFPVVRDKTLYEIANPRKRTA